MKHCPKCGLSKPVGEFSKNGEGYQCHCKACCNEYSKKHYEKNKAKIRAYWKEYRKQNSEEIKAHRKKYDKKYRKQNLEKIKAYFKKFNGENPMRLKLYGSREAAKCLGYVPCNATVEELEASWTGACKICGARSGERKMGLAMDHDHSSGNFRGFLCTQCNTAIGSMRDNPKLLIAAAAYLEGEL